VYVLPTAGGVKLPQALLLGMTGEVFPTMPQIGAVRLGVDPDDCTTPVPERPTAFGDDGAVLVIVSEPL